MRVAALVQAFVIGFFASVVLAQAGLVRRDKPRPSRLIWGVVVLSAISLVMNVITPSGGERMLWAPVALLMFASSLVVARIAPN